MNSITPNAWQDETIVALYFARDEHDIEETARHYGAACMQVSMNILASRPDAEECVNDTYLKTWNSIPPNRPKSLGGYVLRIVRNLSVNRLRDLTAAKRSRDLTLSIHELEACLPAAREGEGDISAELDRFLGTLGERDRRLFLGRYWYNLPVKELAREWGMSANAVSQNLARTRERLRAFLAEGDVSV